MADLIIRGMEMPEHCVGCPLFICEIGDPMACRVGYRRLDNRMVNESKSEWCPIIPLPEGHGRLIDADKMLESIRRQAGILKLMGGELAEIAETIKKGFLQEIDNAPTIVPAEGGNGRCSEN